jgi:hypothetical protein
MTTSLSSELRRAGSPTAWPLFLNVDDDVGFLQILPQALILTMNQVNQNIRRLQEINEAIQEALDRGQDDLPAICVVPVRMLESWFLTDSGAIREASGNPGGRHELELPEIRHLETLPDPKNLLYELLREASGLSGRRRRKLQVNHAVHRIGQLMSGFDALRALSAFRQMEEDLRPVIARCGWNQE